MSLVYVIIYLRIEGSVIDAQHWYECLSDCDRVDVRMRASRLLVYKFGGEWWKKITSRITVLSHILKS